MHKNANENTIKTLQKLIEYNAIKTNIWTIISAKIVLVTNIPLIVTNSEWHRIKITYQSRKHQTFGYKGGNCLFWEKILIIVYQGRSCSIFNQNLEIRTFRSKCSAFGKSSKFRSFKAINLEKNPLCNVFWNVLCRIQTKILYFLCEDMK